MSSELILAVMLGLVCALMSSFLVYWYFKHAISDNND